MYETDAINAHNAKVRTEAEEPIDRDLILDVEFILLEHAIVPYVHD